jgi:hypothetical protein
MNDKLKLTITAIFFVATMQAQIFEPVPLDKKWHIGGGAFAGVWGTFAGNSYTFAMTGHTVAKPIGFDEELIPTQFPTFGCFIIEKVV